MTYFLHARGFTFFPKAELVGATWFPFVDVVNSDTGIVPHRTLGIYATEVAAIRAARHDAENLAAMLKRRSSDLDPH